MSATKLLAALMPDSLRFTTETRMVRLDDKTAPETEQTYLTVHGSPEGFRWLAAQLNKMAEYVEESDCTHSVIVSPRDLKQITMSEWSSLDIICSDLSSDNDSGKLDQ